MPGAGNRAASFAGVLRPLIAGPSGSVASPRLSGWPVRRGNRRPSPAPPPCFPGKGSQWPLLSPSPSHGIRWYSRTGAPRGAGAGVPDHVQWPRVPLPRLSQEGRRRSGVAVALQFHPLHLPGLQAHRRVVAGLLLIPRTGGLNQRWLTLQHPLPRSWAPARK